MFPSGFVKRLDLPLALNVHNAIRNIRLLILVHSHRGQLQQNFRRLLINFEVNWSELS
jgi:hypothetical protein